MADKKRMTETDGAIRTALLSILKEKPLAEVTVSEVARKAHVGRSTFYEHFGNVADVYDSVIGEFSRSLSKIASQVTCSGADSGPGTPFCARLRERSPYEGAVAENRFLPALLGHDGTLEKHDLYGILAGAGYSPDEARAICAFQLAGCFTAARTANVADDAWPDVKAALDRFILSGISACLSAKQVRPGEP